MLCTYNDFMYYLQNLGVNQSDIVLPTEASISGCQYLTIKLVYSYKMANILIFFEGNKAFDQLNVCLFICKHTTVIYEEILPQVSY